MKKLKLSKEEKEIEEFGGELKVASKSTQMKLEQIIEASNKTRSITLRIKENELNHIRREAEKEGLPYQTLITSIIHKYITKQLVEEAAIKKAITILNRV